MEYKLELVNSEDNYLTVRPTSIKLNSYLSIDLVGYINKCSCCDVRRDNFMGSVVTGLNLSQKDDNMFLSKSIDSESFLGQQFHGDLDKVKDDVLGESKRQVEAMLSRVDRIKQYFTLEEEVNIE